MYKTHIYNYNYNILWCFKNISKFAAFKHLHLQSRSSWVFFKIFLITPQVLNEVKIFNISQKYRLGQLTKSKCINMELRPRGTWASCPVANLKTFVWPIIGKKQYVLFIKTSHLSKTLWLYVFLDRSLLKRHICLKPYDCMYLLIEVYSLSECVFANNQSDSLIIIILHSAKNPYFEGPWFYQ